MSTPQIYKLEEVAKHNNEKDCWIVIDGQVYDVTKFLNFHPAGKNVILQFAGKDATEIFHYFHAETVLIKYKKFVIGSLDKTEIPAIKAPILKFENTMGKGIPFGDPNNIQGWFSPFYNETHHALRKNLRKLLQEEYVPHIDKWEENYSIPREYLVKFAKEGIYNVVCGIHNRKELFANNKVCGVEIDQIDSFHEIIVNEELAKTGSGGLGWAVVGGTSIGVPPIIKFGNQFLLDKYGIPALRGDKICCLAITEPWAGSDVSGIRTQAIKSADGSHYVVTGMKKFITTGVYSDCFTTAVRTGKGPGGISLMIIDKNLPGVKTRKMKMQGVWSSGTTFITFDEVKVPAENLIGKEGEGFNYIMQNFNHERFTLAAQTVGLSRCVLEESMSYAHKRKTFGKTLIQHPVIRNKLAHMVRQIEACHSFVEQCAYNIDRMEIKQQNAQLSGAIAILKAHTNNVLEFVASEGVQIFGGQGYTRNALGGKVERIFRDAKAMTQGGGTPEILYDLGIRQISKLMPKPRL